MPNELQSLSDLYQKRLFRIPDYQRGYAWRHEQLVDFWEDLVNLQEGRQHYTGLLSLKYVNQDDENFRRGDSWLLKKGYKSFHVVDGQQRLTTFSILIYELLSFVKNLACNKNKGEEEIFLEYDSLKEISEKYILQTRPPDHIVKTYIFEYETDNPSARYLKHKVFMEPHGNTVVETYYTKNLKYAKTFFAENISATYKVEGLPGLEKLYRKLTLFFMFNLHEIQDDYDVFVAFETMNNRGKKLTNLELLKNRLIYLTTLFDETRLDEINREQLRKNINNAWKEVYYQLGRNQNSALSDDDFLRAHWITYFRYSRKRGDDYIHFLLNKFSAKKVFERTTFVIQLMNGADFLPAFEPMDDDEDVEEIMETETVNIDKLDPIEIIDYVNSLKDMAEHWYFSFFPRDAGSNLSNDEKDWIEKLNRIGIGYFRPIVVAALITAKRTTKEDRINLLTAIERFIFLAFRVGNFNASYKSSEYYNKARGLLQGTVELREITDDLNDTVDATMNNLVSNFISRTDRRFKAGGGFYAWRDLKYFLFEYEHELAAKMNLNKVVDWTMFSRVERDKVTIEHILPQTPNNWYWKNQFRQFNEEEIKLLSNSLGNLLPLAQSINASLQNESFQEKKTPSSDKRRGYSNGSHSEIEVAAEEDWNAQKILKRGLMLLNFMNKRWCLKLTDEQKTALLNIDFVNDGRVVGPELSKEAPK